MLIKVVGVPKVTPGSVAANGLNAGDVILKIGNVHATNLSHAEAQTVIRGASNILQFTIKKGAITSTPVSPTFSAPQYSSNQQTGNQYEPEQEIPNYPDYRVGSGYNNYGSNVTPSNTYNNSMDQFNQSQPVTGYSTLPARGSSGNKQSSESFRPVVPSQQDWQPQPQQQNTLPHKASSGIQLQLQQPYGQSMPHEDHGQYSSATSFSQPMSPVHYPTDQRSEQQYQRQTSVGSNRPESNNHPASYFKKPTPFSPTGNYNQNGNSTPPPRLNRQSSASSQSSVHEATVTSGYQSPFLPKSDDAPPPPPPPVNYTQSDVYRQQSYSQDNGASPYQRQTSQPYQRQASQPGQTVNQVPSPYQQPGMYVDTASSSPSQLQRQGSQQGYNDNRYPQSPAAYQRQSSYGSQQQQQQPQPAPPPPPPQQYGSPYTTPAQPYGRQPSQTDPSPYGRQPSLTDPSPYGRQPSQTDPSPYGRQPSLTESSPYGAASPPGSGGINSFEDILSPFEKFQNSNYCDKLFARDSRDADSGIMSDSYHSQSMSDTPRSNQSSNFSGYSPPQSSYPVAPGPRGLGAPTPFTPQQNQNLLQPAPLAPPPPAVTPPPPPPPPPPSNWRPTPRRAPAQQEPSEGEGGQMPDKVLTAMMKNKGTQKPFSYIPTGLDLKQFKDKARQRAQPRPVMPRGYTGPDLDVDEPLSEVQPAQNSKPRPQGPPGSAPKPDTGVYKHAQYNSPLRMYSSDNANAALNVQSGADVDVAGVNNSHYYYPPRDPQQFLTPSRSPQQFITVPQKTVRYASVKLLDQTVWMRGLIESYTVRKCHINHYDKDKHLNRPTPERATDIQESEVYKMIREADAKGYKPKKPRNPLLRHNSEDDEMRFSGLHTKADIPSKIFQRLNKLTVADDTGVETGGNEPDTQQGTQAEEPASRIGNYDEASIRYRGTYIPSPSFRLLQTMAREDNNQTNASPGRTDDEDDGLPDQLAEEDMVDRRYKGAYIPSKAFKTLQMCVGDDGTTGPPPQQAKPNPKIKVISKGRSDSPQVVNRTESPQIADNPITDF